MRWLTCKDPSNYDDDTVTTLKLVYNDLTATFSSTESSSQEIFQRNRFYFQNQSHDEDDQADLDIEDDLDDGSGKNNT